MSRSDMDAGKDTQRPHPAGFNDHSADINNMAPPCLFCDAAPAVRLCEPGDDHPFAYFCSLACAIEWINLCFAEIGVFYCAKHGCWSDEDGVCPICDCIRFEPADRGDTRTYEEGA